MTDPAPADAGAARPAAPAAPAASAAPAGRAAVQALRHPACVDDLFLYRLTQLATVARGPVVRLCEREHGITRREWRLLGLLAVQPAAGPFLSPSALADRARLDRARTSRALGSLVAKGLVLRTAAPADRREAQLTLSSAGQQVYAALLPRIAAINRELLTILSDDEVQLLDGLLRRLTARAMAVSAAEAVADPADDS